MNAVTLVFVSLCIFAIAYRFYGLFIANKVLNLRAGRPTPAETCSDGIDYVKTNKFVLFGHHFAAIAALVPCSGLFLRRSSVFCRAHYGSSSDACLRGECMIWLYFSPRCATKARASQR